MDLNTVWFLLIGVLLTGYAILDGFDLGVGILHIFARDEKERRIHTNAIKPVWDGNEVWLLTGGGTMFAAFPVVYATVFSGFYLAFMLLLFALILRAVSLEFRGKVDCPVWRTTWDWGFRIGSLLPAILYGVAAGNVLRGLPIAADGTLNVPFLSLLNPYALLVGLVTLAMAVMHGAAFLALKTEGDLQQRMARWTVRAWAGLVALVAVFAVATVLGSWFLFDGAAAKPLWWLFLALALAGIVWLPLASRAGRLGQVFLASATAIASILGLLGASLYPRMVPSSIDLSYSLTITNASSTPYTLRVMLIVALAGVPLVIAYTAYIYVVFKGKPALAEDGY
jgi:cytochrome d ubiquinol oxidase subunit II